MINDELNFLATEDFPATQKPTESVAGITVRLAGDSGDGMQLLGSQLTNTSALSGNDVATYPDFPAEIRAPAGTTYGVSGFQIHFASADFNGSGLSGVALGSSVTDLGKRFIVLSAHNHYAIGSVNGNIPGEAQGFKKRDFFIWNCKYRRIFHFPEYGNLKVKISYIYNRFQ